jgi:hypothetical protein
LVVSPGTGERLVYRDSGLPGDEVVRQVVTGAARHLAPGGTCQVLANWVHREDEPWESRLRSWLAPTGFHAWVVERELTDPARYVELWLDDAGLRGTAEYVARYDTWLEWFRQQGATAVGFGWVTISDAAGQPPYVQVESWPYDVEQPLGPHVDAWLRAVRLERGVDDAALLDSRLVLAQDVVEERVGPPGGAEQERIVLRSQRGMRRARTVSTAAAGMVGACDGDLTLGQIVGALSTLLDAPVDVLRAELVPAAREMLVDGFLFAGQ